MSSCNDSWPFDLALNPLSTTPDEDLQAMLLVCDAIQFQDDALISSSEAIDLEFTQYAETPQLSPDFDSTVSHQDMMLTPESMNLETESALSAPFLYIGDSDSPEASLFAHLIASDLIPLSHNASGYAIKNTDYDGNDTDTFLSPTEYQDFVMANLNQPEAPGNRKTPDVRSEPHPATQSGTSDAVDTMPQDAPPDSEPEYEIERLQSHRVQRESATVDLFVLWKDGSSTWEPEHHLQLQVPELVLNYWSSKGSREAATGLEDLHVLRVLDCRPRPPTYLVQWVGYGDDQANTSWESIHKLRKIAPYHLASFQASQKMNALLTRSLCQKRPRGRPEGKLGRKRAASACTNEILVCAQP